MRMTKKYFVGLSIIALLLVAAFITFHYHKASERKEINVEAFQSPKGWGYKIKVGSKVFIKQQYIPAIQGYKVFTSKEKALLVGEKVMEKIKNKKLPSITVEELKKMGILNDSLKVI
jgi:hypothetical protein